LFLAQINALFLFEFVCEVIDDAHVEVFTAEEGIAIGGFDLEHAVANFEDGDVEGAAAQIVDGNRAGLLLVEAVSQGSCSRLVDDAQDFKARDLAGILGSLGAANR